MVAERIVAYESSALIRGEGGPEEEKRPEQYRPPHWVLQRVASYLSNPTAVRERLEAARSRWAIVFPEDAEGPVAGDLFPRLVTIASGEKLLRNADKFQALRDIHGKVEVAEMEAIGVATACENAMVPLIVVRGISDFGDAAKDDRFHPLAARAAAVVALDLVFNASLQLSAP